MKKLTPHQRIEYSLKFFPENHILTSSFGAHSSVMLHILNEVYPKIPVIILDTQYLFAETYQFMEEMKHKFNLNLKLYKSLIPKEEQELLYGKLWEGDEREINFYNKINKLIPMDNAINELSVGTWFSGIRSVDSDERQKKDFVEDKNGIKKVYPILDWDNKEIYYYMKKHNLPYHPLYEKGYTSIGDWHSTKSIYEVNDNSELRFNGIKRECGLHE